jgi:hypothetical protein
MTLRIAEALTIGVLDGAPAASSPGLRVATPGRCGAITPLATLLEPAGAWDAAALERAGALATTAWDGAAALRAERVGGQLQRLTETLNDAARAGGGGTRPARFGLTVAALVGDDFLAAQLPPGLLAVRQGADVHVFPPFGDGDGLGVAEPWPLGERASVAPRLLQTRLAPGDLLLVCTSTVARRCPALGHELTQSRSADDALTRVADACDRAGLRDGALCVLRFERA